MDYSRKRLNSNAYNGTILSWKLNFTHLYKNGILIYCIFIYFNYFSYEKLQIVAKQ